MLKGGAYGKKEEGQEKKEEITFVVDVGWW
jgi:hypothetical protein